MALRAEMAIGRTGSKSGLAKIGPVFSGQNCNSPARPKNRVGQAKLSFQGKKKFGRAGPYRAGPYWAGQIWPGFFQANNLMAQSGPNFGRTRLAHWVGPILPPLLKGSRTINYSGVNLRFEPSLVSLVLVIT